MAPARDRGGGIARDSMNRGAGRHDAAVVGAALPRQTRQKR